jgi:hypothetical protein
MPMRRGRGDLRAHPVRWNQRKTSCLATCKSGDRLDYRS